MNEAATFSLFFVYVMWSMFWWAFLGYRFVDELSNHHYGKLGYYFYCANVVNTFLFVTNIVITILLSTLLNL